MQLTCPQCRQGVSADDVNLNTELAKCRACHSVFSFRRQIESLATVEYRGAERKPVGPRPLVPQPAKFTIDDFGTTYQVRWRWFTWEVIFLTFFCLFWDGFLVVWYAVGIFAGGPWIMLAFPVLHVAVGVFLTYLVLASYLNSTTVRLDGGQLVVRHGPLPWRGNLSRSTADFQQLYCREREVRNKNSRRLEYDLHAVLVDGGDVKLVTGLRDRAEALYLEQELEQRLRIKDEPVGGELGRW